MLVVRAVVPAHQQREGRGLCVLQLVHDGQHHVGSEELAEAAGGVRPEPTNYRRRTSERSIEVRSAETDSCLLVEGLHGKVYIVLLVAKKESACLPVTDANHPYLGESGLAHDDVLDLQRRLRRIAAGTQKPRRVRLSFPSCTTIMDVPVKTHSTGSIKRLKKCVQTYDRQEKIQLNDLMMLSLRE